MAQRDGDAEVRDAVEVIHRAVDGVDDPLVGAGLVSGDAFLAEDRVLRKAGEQHARDEILRTDVELELDVVRLKRIHLEAAAEVFAEELAGGARGFNGDLERGMSHPVSKQGAGTMRKKKAGGEMNLLPLGIDALKARSTVYFFFFAPAFLAAGLAADF